MKKERAPRDRSRGKTNDPEVKHPDRNDAPQHFTPHQSRLSQEGRRNQPRHASPKYVKQIQTAAHVAEAEQKEEMGVLAPFASPERTLENEPDHFSPSTLLTRSIGERSDAR